MKKKHDPLSAHAYRRRCGHTGPPLPALAVTLHATFRLLESCLDWTKASVAFGRAGPISTLGGDLENSALPLTTLQSFLLTIVGDRGSNHGNRRRPWAVSKGPWMDLFCSERMGSDDTWPPPRSRVESHAVSDCSTVELDLMRDHRGIR